MMVKIYKRYTEMEKALIVCALFGQSMVIARVIIAKEPDFLFMIWNLILAFIPYFISKRLSTQSDRMKNNLKFALIFIAWLLFIPNSFYIITDLFHLHRSDAMPVWFDLALIFSFAWNGLMLGIISVMQMERIIRSRFHIRHEFVFLFPVMCLIALGVYIGRYMRFNSWDLVTNPLSLFSDISYMFVHPLRNFSDWAMIGCFSIFMTIMYICIKRMTGEINKS
jgi:uncharacterized membrane protein